MKTIVSYNILNEASTVKIVGAFLLYKNRHECL